MKNSIILSFMCIAGFGSAACDRAPKTEEQPKFEWVVDKFDDIKVLRYRVPGFEELPLEQKKLIYYLSQATVEGRDILYDQNFKYNLAIRRSLENIYRNYTGEKSGENWEAFEKYLKKVWFANGIHHHYSNEKFRPEFDGAYFDMLVEGTPESGFPTENFGSLDGLMTVIKPIIFDPELYPMRLDQRDGIDMLAHSAMNYYEGVTQAEAERYYELKAQAYPDQEHPISFGLNSKLVMKAKGHGNLTMEELVWKVGGMYSPAIERIVGWLYKARGEQKDTGVSPLQHDIISALIEFYHSGELEQFDRYNILWVQDTLSRVDFINGFIEVYGDPLGYKAAWEGMVNIKDEKATRRTEAISEEAQWFEDHSPVDDKYKKAQVKGVSAKVIDAAMLGGDSYPATPIGINLPNADWIRRDHGSKSVTIQNITDAYAEAAKGNGFNEEFMLRKEDRERIDRYGALADNLHTDLHECLGHGSGQLAPGVKGDELKNYGSTLEEARADLFALYYLADPKMVEMGIVPDMELYKAEYARYVMNGMMTQFMRIEPGKNVEEAHMRNRKLIAEWVYEKGREGNVVEKVVENGKTYIVVNDFEKLRGLFGELLREIQRIKSEGDFKAGRDLVEKYGVKIDPALHKEVLARYATLGLQPYSGFVNPVYTPVMENGKIVDVKISYDESYVEQMLRYSNDYSHLPTMN